jgi:hypothetical protein
MKDRFLMSRKARLALAVLLVAMLVQLTPAGEHSAAEAYDFVGAMFNVIPFAGFIGPSALRPLRSYCCHTLFTYTYMT